MFGQFFKKGFQSFGKSSFKSFTKNQNQFFSTKAAFKNINQMNKNIQKQQINDTMAAISLLTNKLSLSNPFAGMLEELSGDQDEDSLSNRSRSKPKRKSRSL